MERRTIIVSGTVQGVGYRPFVYVLASRLGLSGFVRNRAAAVEIEAEGSSDALETFLDGLLRHAPPLARVEEVVWEPAVTTDVGGSFHIRASETRGRCLRVIAADAATCDDCVRELFDPADRRFRYPFLSCSDCGPRLTIVDAVPYDRERTAMAPFELCDACREEYRDPTNRRFHAETIACWTCGPRVAFCAQGETESRDADAIDDAVRALGDGKIIAVKGLGGYHLACDATSDEAIRRLRRRKRRDEKPFAVMVTDVAEAASLCELTDGESELLQTPRRPIVLARRMARTPLAHGVAPTSALLGVFLPYTPLHHLLLRGFGRPLVMTSGNRSDEPMCRDDGEARDRLGNVADAFLQHNRTILLRCDDSIVRETAGVPVIVRRARGHAPEPVLLPRECANPVLAVGGQWKATFAIGVHRRAVLSHHIGDLDDVVTYRDYVASIERYERLFDVRPALLVHDLHPDYVSTRYAIERAESQGLPRLGIQHHHAHVAACLAENGVTGPAIGVAFDGTGYGADGTIWGGEFLVVEGARMKRVAHLRAVPLPGGDRAIRQPWRSALAHLNDAETRTELVSRFVSRKESTAVARMLERRVNAPLTTSAGRLFDAVAAIAGVRGEVNYEAQAAIELEGLASMSTAEGSYPFTISSREGGRIEIDTRPLIRAVADDVARGVAAADVARRFHVCVADLVVETCRQIRADTGLSTVALSGGVFVNALLASSVPGRLGDTGFVVMQHRLVPPNDGGLCFGQLAVAAATEVVPRNSLDRQRPS